MDKFLNEEGLTYLWNKIKEQAPVKGTDYWTAADKEEIVNDVLAALVDGNEVSY